jgi:hypothetical protein
MSAWKKHEIFEKNSIILVIGILVAISVGGLVEIAPLFYLKSTIEKTEGMRPYTPLELAGREIYIREGCYTCHSQMIRPMRDELERYGHFSLAAESMYDHPFQWGSKRTGPDLARVGGKYSDDWHVEHLIDPRSLVPASIMPGYPFLKPRPSCSPVTFRVTSAPIWWWVFLTRMRNSSSLSPMPSVRRLRTPTGLMTSKSVGRIRRFATSTATRVRSPRWMRSSPIFRCSEPWSTSRSTTTKPT